MFNKQLCWDLSAAVADANYMLAAKQQEEPDFNFADIGITSEAPLTLADLLAEATYQHSNSQGGASEARTLAASGYT